MISPIEPWVARLTGLEAHLTAEALSIWQLERVREAIEYARAHSKFYEECFRGIAADKVLSMEDMQRIPFTWPEEVIRDPKDFICVPQREISRVISLPTSGSQGMPKRIYFTERDMERTIDFFTQGMSTMVQRGQTVLVLMSGQTQFSIGDLLQKGLAPMGVSTLIHGNVKDVNKAIEAARGIDCLVGVPGEIICMCRIATDLRPQSVLLSADYVPESVIKGIEDTWKCRVFTHYGMTETGFGGGVQCEAKKGYHLRDADLLIEIVDVKTGLQVPAGQYGEVTITTLSREAMPLIRYRTGDIARILTGACPCGGILPRLDKVTGRRANIISFNSGEQLSIHELDEIMYGIPLIRNYRAEIITEEGKPVLKLSVEAALGLNHEWLLTHLKAKVPCCIELKISYEQVEPFCGTQKRRIIIGLQ